jgi:hypothetical protein
MAHINFDTHGTHTTSYTKCPYGKAYYVGSAGCDNCPHNVLTDEVEDYVICNADGSMNERVYLQKERK